MIDSSVLDLNLALKELKEFKDILTTSWGRANKASIEADGKMQSRYDTQKEEFAAEAVMIQSQIHRVDRLISRLENLQRPEDITYIQIGHLIQIQMEDDDLMNVLLLEDQGGSVLSGIQLISIKSPLGKALLGKRVDDSVMYLGPVGEIEARILAIV